MWPPDDIKTVIQNTPNEDQKKWLGESVTFGTNPPGKVEDVLKDVHKQLKLANATSQERDNYLIPLKEFLVKLLPKTLAAFAAKHAKVAFDFTFAMDDSQLAVVLPQLNIEALDEIFSKQSIEKHSQIMLYMTSEQKMMYVDKDLAKSLAWENWTKKQKPDLSKQIDGGINTSEDYESIQNKFADISALNKQIFVQYKQAIKSLEKTMTKFSSADLPKINAYLEAKKTQQNAFEKELKEMRALIEKLEEKSQSSEIPDEFLDIITTEMMEDPYSDEHGRNLDKKTWDSMNGVNPFDRGKVIIKPNTSLKEKIDAYKKNRDKA